MEKLKNKISSSCSANQVIGIVMIFSSALFFYLATAVIRWAKVHATIAPEEFLFARMLTGFTIVSLFMLSKKTPPKPKNLHYLLGRVVTNAIAVLCFYTAVEKSGAASANILNMTYPIFIAIISWFMFRKQRDGVAVIIALISFSGVWMILSENGLTLDINNLWGLASGIFASIAIIYLNLLRREHDSDTVLFFVFGVGALLTIICFWKTISLPDINELTFLLVCSAFGVAGQYSLTIGQKYVTALESGIISSTRILMAALLGPFLAFDTPLSATGWIGAVLIFSANVYLTIRKVKKNKVQ